MDEQKPSEDSTQNTTLPGQQGSLWQSRLVRRTMGVLLLVLVVINTAILIPSYQGFITNQLEQLENEGLKLVQGLIFQPVEAPSPNSLPLPLFGMALYSLEGEREKTYGPEELFPETWGGLLVQPDTEDLHWTHWETEQLGKPYHVVALLKTERLKSRTLHDFKRFVSLVLLINLCILIGIMLALKFLLLKPLLNLAQRLSTANADPLNSGKYITPLFRADELGDLHSEINSLLEGQCELRGQLDDKKEQLRATNLMLEMQMAEKLSMQRTNQHKNEFLSDISYKLRNNVQKILGHTMLKNPQNRKGVDLERAFKVIHESSVQISEALNELLDYSRLESGGKEYNLEDTDLGGLIREVERSQGASIEKKSLSIAMDFMTRQLIVICDRRKIRRVFNILISNAILCSPEKGEIRVGFRRFYDELDEEWLSCTFSDQGTAMQDSEIEGLFDKSSHLITARPGSDATAMGLAICKEIAEAHGGSIKAENKDEGGRLFTLQLPLKGRLA